MGLGDNELGDNGVGDNGVGDRPLGDNDTESQYPNLRIALIEGALSEDLVYITFLAKKHSEK